MKEILNSIIFLILAINSLFGNEDDMGFRVMPIIEVDGATMPGWERKIIEIYHDEEGQPVPVIFKGAAKDWEAANWTPEWFVEKFGDEEIVVVEQDLVENGRNPIKIDTTINDHIIDILLNPNNSGYLLASLQHNATQDDFDKKFEDNFRKNSLFIYSQLNLVVQTGFPQIEIRPRSERIYTLFIGSKNSIAPLHSHGSVFLSQIYGKKMAKLVHFKHAEKFYCEFSENNSDEKCIDLNENSFENIDTYNTLCCCPLDESEHYASDCAIDIEIPDFKNHPELQGIEVQEAILEPGDILYIPKGRLHHISAISTSISIASGF